MPLGSTRGAVRRYRKDCYQSMGIRNEDNMLTRIGLILGIGASVVAILTFIFTYGHPSTGVSQPPNSPTATGSGTGTGTGNAYPPQAQQDWLNACEQTSNATVAYCQCELSYFEQHASYQVFEQEYGNMPPGVPPPQMANASNSCGSNL